MDGTNHSWEFSHAVSFIRQEAVREACRHPKHQVASLRPSAVTPLRIAGTAQPAGGEFDLVGSGSAFPLSLTENTSGATPTIVISEPSPNISLLKIDLGAGYSFANTSTTWATGLTYQNPGSPTTSQFATIDISQVNDVRSLAASLPGDTLTLGPIYDSHAGIGSIVATAGSIEVAGVNTASTNGNVDLIATGNLTVDPGAIVQAGMGTISLAADVNADGTGNDGLGTLSIDAGATVVSASPTASAITLRGPDIDIDTSANPAVVRSTGSLSTIATLAGLNNPSALAFDGSGNLYVSNLGPYGSGTTVSKLRRGASSLAPPSLG